MMPRSEIIVPLFPLPNVVMFPGVLMPLHIFETRYRAMTKDALEGGRMLGMVLLEKGWENNYEGAPPVFSIGCVGEIVQEERFSDGRYNIVLQGISRFYLKREIKKETLYRHGSIVPFESIVHRGQEEAVDDLRRKVLAMCTEILVEMKLSELLPYASSLTAGQLFDTAAFYLNMPVEKKRDILMAVDVFRRGEILMDILKERVTVIRFLKQHRNTIPPSPAMN